MKLYDLKSILYIHDSYEDKLKKWVINFLNSNGNNSNLANSIKKIKNKCKITFIKNYELKKLSRINGPDEEKLLYSEKKEVWDKKVKELVKAIKSKTYKPTPLIVTNIWDNKYQLVDGAHRHAAFEQLGITEYYTIFIKII